MIKDGPQTDPACSGSIESPGSGALGDGTAVVRGVTQAQSQASTRTTVATCVAIPSSTMLPAESSHVVARRVGIAPVAAAPSADVPEMCIN